MREVTLLGYGAGNLASVRFALERLGAKVRVTANPRDIASADRIILPGVGAAGYAMARLRRLGLVEPLRAFPRPLLGICLGQQLLFESSDEADGDSLLGMLPGNVRRLAPHRPMPVPHVGWSRLAIDQHDPLLEGVPTGAYAYFVHGYVCPDGPDTVAYADYGGRIPAVVRRDNRLGCQFHPERSAHVGAVILRNFLELEA